MIGRQTFPVTVFTAEYDDAFSECLDPEAFTFVEYSEAVPV